jgi:hypothetical protein
MAAQRGIFQAVTKETNQMPDSIQKIPGLMVVVYGVGVDGCDTGDES